MQTFEKPQIKHPQNRTFCQSMKIGYSTKSKWVHSSKMIKLTVFFSDQSIYVYFSIFYSLSMFHKMLLYLSRINFFIKFKLHVHAICGNPLIYIFFTNLMIIKKFDKWQLFTPIREFTIDWVCKHISSTKRSTSS